MFVCVLVVVVCVVVLCLSIVGLRACLVSFGCLYVCDVCWCLFVC